MKTIEYFYSAYSAYAYLGSAEFLRIAAAAGRQIVHRPYDLRPTVVAVGSTEMRSRPDNHRAYFFGREMARWAEQRGIPMLAWPQHHTNDPSLANRVLIAAEQMGHNVDALAHTMLESHWVRDTDLADADTLRSLCAEVELDGDFLVAAADGEAAIAQYQANTEEAVARSVFGSPTYFVDGDMFYGQDRLHMVERALSKPYAGTWPPA